MTDASNILVAAVLIGTGATVFMDVVAAARKRLFGTAAPDYGLVGRWVAWMPRGRFVHESIAKTPPVPAERAIGWMVHYMVGIAFAAVLPALWGIDWIRQPAIGPALLVGIGSVTAPFLLMQPGMGAGIAASRTPRPGVARLRSLVNHGTFGLGLYAAGWAVHLACLP